MPTEPTDPPAVPAIDPAAQPAWKGQAAEQLADWALARLVNRTDRHGGYYKDKGGRVKTLTKPAKGSQSGVVGRELLLRHFRPARYEDIVGGHALTPAAEGAPSVGRWAGFDFDNHGGSPVAAARNLRYVVHLYHKAAALGFRPLLLTWGTGGYHLWLLFDAAVPGAVLHAFAHWFVSDAAGFGYYAAREGDPLSGMPEANPKQASVKAGGFGNWLRFPGRHHKVKAWAVAFDGEKWVQGADAVALVLSRTGDSPALIPPAAAPAEKKAKPPGRPTAGGTAGPTPRAQADRPDVFAHYNREVTLDMVVAWHEQYGRHEVTARGAGRVEFRRGGKDEGGNSFNVEVRDLVPVTYNFSSAAGIPHNTGLSPSQVRCFYERGACDPRTMREFAAQLRRELGWAAEGTDQAASGGATPPADAGKPGTGPDADAFEGTPKHTDLSNARRFVADHRDNVVYADDLKCYFVFNGVVWERDPNGNIAGRLAQQTVREMAMEAAQAVAAAAAAYATAVTKEEQDAAAAARKRADADLKWAATSCDAKLIGNLVKLARSHLLIPNAGDVFDTQPWLLNCPNGTVDLRTGQLLEHRREDMITKLCPTRYNPSAPAPTYLRFLAAVLPHPELAAYARYLSGYFVTGEVMDQSLVICHGTGANGKTTWLELLVRVLGPSQYATTAPPELVVGGGESRHPVEKTVLRGARLAVCQETDDDEALDAKRVKALTGASRVQARGMRENFSDFPPTHKLVLATNPLPRVKSQDHATWRRVRVLHFAVQFWTDIDRAREPGREYPLDLRADPLLPAKLAAEAEGVLADMVAHAGIFYASGREVPVPPAVAEAVQKYRLAEDYVGRFFVSCCDDAGLNTGAHWRTRAGQFYKAYLDWYRIEVDPNMVGIVGSKTFGERAAARYKKKAHRGLDYYSVVIRLPTGREGEEKAERAEPPKPKEGATRALHGFDALLG